MIDELLYLIDLSNLLIENGKKKRKISECVAISMLKNMSK